MLLHSEEQASAPLLNFSVRLARLKVQAESGVSKVLSLVLTSYLELHPPESIALP